MDNTKPLGALEERILQAACERILPSDDGAGATEADVLGYIRRAISQGRFSERRRQLLGDGLELLQSLALAAHDRDFSSCGPHQRDAVLQQLEAIPHRVPRRFLALLIGESLDGFLCDPVHGGNRDRVGWRYVGYRPRPVSDQRPKESP